MADLTDAIRQVPPSISRGTEPESISGTSPPLGTQLRIRTKASRECLALHLVSRSLTAVFLTAWRSIYDQNWMLGVHAQHPAAYNTCQMQHLPEQLLLILHTIPSSEGLVSWLAHAALRLLHCLHAPSTSKIQVIGYHSLTACSAVWVVHGFEGV